MTDLPMLPQRDGVVRFDLRDGSPGIGVDSLARVHVLDQLLYMLPTVSAALLIVALISRQTWLSSRRMQPDATTTKSKARSRVVAGLTRWLAIRLMFVWLLVLVVRLGLGAA